MSFGQGLAIPLVQMVRAIGAIANKGVMVTPHFLISKGTETVEWKSSGQVVSAETARQVTDMMRTVVEEGTAEAAQVPGYDIAGKTGTGEKADLGKGGYLESSFTSSLIGFAPAADPVVLVYVGLNGTPYLAASSSAPLFSSIMSEALTDMGVLPAS
jgi:cell division protein FtsI (penicillin-binding protein 3)